VIRIAAVGLVIGAILVAAALIIARQPFLEQIGGALLVGSLAAVLIVWQDEVGR